MDGLLNDLRFALRMLGKNPGFALVAVMTLALGIGANTAIFSVINAVLIRPVPGVKNPAELVTFERLQKNNPDFVFAYPDYLDYVDQSQSFAGLAARCRTPLALSSGTTERVPGELITGNYFSILGINPAVGRLIGPADVQAGQESAVAVLSYNLWRRSFGSDPQVLGRNIQLNGHGFTVVGVAAGDFAGTVKGAPTDIWLPLTMQPEAIPRMSQDILHSRTAGWIGIFGRLKPEVRLSQARQEMQTIAARLALSYPSSNEHRGVELHASFGMDPDDRATLGKFFVLLFASVSLLLLISCSNVSNLLLARADSRRKEIALRIALGASRRRLVRQLLTEGVLLSILAGALGLLLAPWVASLMIAFHQPAYALTNMDTTPDGRVLGFTLFVAVLTGVLFALAPALQTSKPDLVTALKENSSNASPLRARLQNVLIIVQVALSLVLLIEGGVTLRRVQRILNRNPGFETSNLLLMTTDLSIQGFSEPQGLRFYEELLRRFKQVPGIRSTTLATTVPPDEWSGRISIFLEGQAPPDEFLRGHEFEVGIRVDVDTVAPAYFATLGIPILQGRDFAEQDREGTPLVAIVSQRLAHRLWPGQNPVGKRIEWPDPWRKGPPRPPLEIIGVAADVRYRSLMADAPLLVYLPLFQNYSGREIVAIHTSGNPADLLPVVRRTVASLDTNLPVFAVKTMAEQVAGSLWQQRMATALIGTFSLLALALAAVGLYALLSHWMGQRTHEIGIHMALGAQPRAVMRLVVGHGAWLALAGIVAGILVSLVATPLVSSQLFGAAGTFWTNSTPTSLGISDVLTMTAVVMLLVLIALLACAVPARRATRVDPVEALRYE